MAGCLIGMHRDMCIIKALLDTVSSSSFNSMVLNSKLYKAVLYIQDNKAWEVIYFLLKLIFHFLQLIFLDDINKAGVGKGLLIFHNNKDHNTEIIL